MSEHEHPTPRAEPGTGAAPQLLTGSAVVLRGLRESDVPRIVEACSDPVTQHWLGQMPSPYSESDAVAWLADRREQAAAGAAITWAIAVPEGDELVGAINLFDIEPGDQAEVGYWAHPSVRGRGLVTEACRLAVDHGFAALGLQRVIGHAALENIASQKVLQASGLRPVGVVPDGTTLRTGKADAALFSRETDARPDVGA